MSTNLSTIREEIDIFHGPPLQVLSDCIRGFLVPASGKKLIAVDFEQIEARVLAWLAGEEHILEIFRGHGKIYEYAAAAIYGVPLESIDKEDPRRQVGKVSELAFGFQGGKGAFARMSKSHGVKKTAAEAEAIKLAWRAKRPKTVAYWSALNQAAKDAIFAPGTKFTAGHTGRHVTYKKDGSFLWCRLPSGRVICYPYPRIEMVDAPWTKESGEKVQAVTYMAEDSQSRQWMRFKAYGGLFCENVTQATASCLLRTAIVNLEEAGFEVVIHVHDEAVVEVDKEKDCVKEVERLACLLPPWAKDLPLAGSAWEGPRYKK